MFDQAQVSTGVAGFGPSTTGLFCLSRDNLAVAYDVNPARWQSHGRYLRL